MLKDKFTAVPWSTVQAGAATMVYGPNGERICKVMDNKNDANIIEVAPDLIWLIEQIYNDLPQNRDWLNPDYEEVMKYIIDTYCKETIDEA